MDGISGVVVHCICIHEHVIVSLSIVPYVTTSFGVTFWTFHVARGSTRLLFYIQRMDE